jgi:hypothetical protein
MRRTTTVLTRIATVSAAFAAGVLLAAAPAGTALAEAPRGGETGTLLMPIIGSGTHPIEIAADSWGVGNGVTDTDAPISAQGSIRHCPCPVV